MIDIFYPSQSRGNRPLVGSRVLLFALATLLTTGGCGYHLARRGNNLPPDIRRIAIPVLENRSMEPGLEANLTDALRRRFAEGGWVQIVDVDESDAVLTGQVTRFSSSPISFSEGEFAVEYRAQLRVWLRLMDRQGVVLWEDRNLVKVREYRNSGDVFTAEAAKLDAITWLVREISAEAHDRIFDGFE